MGTKALRVYRVRGRYYCIREYFSGNPTGVGRQVVDEIPDDPGEFESNPPHPQGG